MGHIRANFALNLFNLCNTYLSNSLIIISTLCFLELTSFPQFCTHHVSLNLIVNKITIVLLLQTLTRAVKIRFNKVRLEYSVRDICYTKMTDGYS